MGVGWTVEGLSEIRRCRKTPVLDGLALDVQLNGRDALCLDGVRLVHVASPNCENGGIEYRPERDPFIKVCAHGGDTRGPDYFVAWDKAGRILKYGEADDAYPEEGVVEVNVHRTPTLLPIGKPIRVTLAWPVTRIADRRGNYMTIRYTGTMNEALANLAPTTEERAALAAAVGGPLISPARIEYTSYFGSNGTKKPQRSIDFEYSTSLRPDIVYGHYRGHTFAIATRLERIVADGPGEPGVWRYEFAYDNSSFSDRSHVSTIRKCAGDGACLPPLTFEWSSGPGASWTEISPSPLSSAYVPRFTNVRPATAFIAEVNGDGVGDLVQLGGHRRTFVRGSTPASPNPFSTIFNSGMLLHRSGMGIPIDINNDGRTDLLATAPPGEDPDPYYAAPIWYQSGVSGLEQVNTQRTLPFANMEKANEVWAGDFNGDNAADLLFYGGSSGNEQFWFASNTGAGLDSVEPTGVTAGASFPYSITFVMDVDGDGSDELIFYTQTSWKMATFKSDGTAPQIWKIKQLQIPKLLNHASSVVKVLDVNGDGLDDLIGWSWEGCFTTWRNTGRRLRPINALPPCDESGPRSLEIRRSVMLDYDGDRASELLVPAGGSISGTGSVRLLRWDPITMKMTSMPTGISFRLANLGDDNSPDYSGQAPWVLASDVTRDGLTDVIVGDADGWRVYRRDSVASNAAAPDMLIGIRTGLNPPLSQAPDITRPSIEISYATTTDPSVYAAGPWPLACSSDSWCVNPALTVVSHVTDSDIAPGSEFKYSYRHAKVHHRGRGWIGFGKRVISEHEQSGQGSWISDTTETYDVDGYVPDVGDFPYRFQPQTVETRQAGERPDTWRVQRRDAIEPQWRRLIGSGTYFAFYKFYELKTRDYLGDGSYSDWLRKIVTTQEFDDFGNLTNLTTEVETPQPNSTTLGEHLSNARLVHRLDLDSKGPTTETLSRTYYAHDESKWLVSLVSSETTTSNSGICAFDPAPAWLAPINCDPRANTRIREFTYTGDGLLESTIVKLEPGQPELDLTTTLSYDAYGNIERLEGTGLADTRGNARTRFVELGYESSEAIFPSNVTNALGHSNDLVFDRSFGSQVFARNPNGVITWTPIDGLGRLGAARRSGGRTAIFEYINALATNENGPSIIWHARESSGADILIEYDRTGRATRTVAKGFDGKSVYRDIRYDDLGRIEFMSFPYFGFQVPAGGVFEHGTTYTFDNLDRPMTISRPDGKTTLNYEGLVTEVFSPRGNRTTYLANGSGQTTAVQDAGGGVIQYVYGTYGMPAHLVDDDNNVTSIQFDKRGRKTRLVDPDLGTRQYRYNAFNEIIQELNAEGEERVRFDYDLLGRPITRKDADGATQWRWDTAPGGGIGALASSESPDGQTETRSYDTFGRLVSRKLGRNSVSGGDWTFDFGFGYDNQGSLRTLTYPSNSGNSLVVQYEYGPTGFLSQVMDVTVSGPRPVLWSAKRYDAWGRIIEQGFGETSTGQPRLTTTWKYDPVSARLADIETTRVTETGTDESLQALTHWFDENGNLSRRKDDLRPNEIDAREQFEYDELDRLSMVFGADADWNPIEQTFSARYNSIGNIVSTSDLGDYTYDGAQPHAVTNAGDTSYRYDGRGNMIDRGRAEITYTPFDLPRSVEEVDVGKTLYQYDARRMRAVRESPQDETTLYADGLYEQHEDGSGNATELLYVPALGRHVGVLIRTPDGGKKLYFIHRDHLGSPTALTSAEDGRVVERRKYGPFGRLKSRIVEDADTDTIDLGFTGHDDEHKSDLVNMRGRIYDARLGRFTTPDPFVQAPFFSQSLNRYSYVLNNPASLVDPNGFEVEDITVWGVPYDPLADFALPTDDSFSMSALILDAQRFYATERREKPGGGGRTGGPDGEDFEVFRGQERVEETERKSYEQVRDEWLKKSFRFAQWQADERLKELHEELGKIRDAEELNEEIEEPNLALIEKYHAYTDAQAEADRRQALAVEPLPTVSINTPLLGASVGVLVGQFGGAGIGAALGFSWSWGAGEYLEPEICCSPLPLWTNWQPTMEDFLGVSP